MTTFNDHFASTPSFTEFRLETEIDATIRHLLALYGNQAALKTLRILIAGGLINGFLADSLCIDLLPPRAADAGAPTPTPNPVPAALPPEGPSDSSPEPASLPPGILADPAPALAVRPKGGRTCPVCGKSISKQAMYCTHHRQHGQNRRRKPGANVSQETSH